ncbi:energy transducer TonB [Alteromonas sp. S167]|uniref:energy transducer TonB n=1 Tax=Alteromonas sp. S167 TaxID=3117402 RepID=UPI002FE25B4F
MRRILFLTSVLALSACSTTPEVKDNELQPIDLIGKKDALEEMWIVSKTDYPKYPINAAKQGISGCVDFSFVINSDGKAQDIQVIKAIPGSIFIGSAKKSLKKFRWQPTELNNLRQPAITTLQLDFSTSPVMKVAECIVDDA